MERVFLIKGNGESFLIKNCLIKQLSFLDRLRLFYYFQRGDHLENLDYIVHKKISSFQIIPDDKDSLITCDGELLENTPVSILKTSIQMNLLSMFIMVRQLSKLK